VAQAPHVCERQDVRGHRALSEHRGIHDRRIKTFFDRLPALGLRMALIPWAIGHGQFFWSCETAVPGPWRVTAHSRRSCISPVSRWPWGHGLCFWSC